jgi:acyl carrier protein
VTTGERILPQTETKTRIRGFLGRFVVSHDLADTDDIFAAGFVTSMFATQLVVFVEREFRVSVDNEDLDFDNFRSIDAISRLIARKTTADTGSGGGELSPDAVVTLDHRCS